MIITEIQKNKKERIAISLDKYRDHDICNIRVCFEAEPGVWVPTRKGIAFSTALLTEVIKGLMATEKSLSK